MAIGDTLRLGQIVLLASVLVVGAGCGASRDEPAAGAGLEQQTGIAPDEDAHDEPDDEHGDSHHNEGLDICSLLTEDDIDAAFGAHWAATGLSPTDAADASCTWDGQSDGSFILDVHLDGVGAMNAVRAADGATHSIDVIDAAQDAFAVTHTDDPDTAEVWWALPDGEAFRARVIGRSDSSEALLDLLRAAAEAWEPTSTTADGPASKSVVNARIDVQSNGAKESISVSAEQFAEADPTAIGALCPGVDGPSEAYGIAITNRLTPVGGIIAMQIHALEPVTDPGIVDASLRIERLDGTIAQFEGTLTIDSSMSSGSFDGTGDSGQAVATYSCTA